MEDHLRSEPLCSTDVDTGQRGQANLQPELATEKLIFTVAEASDAEK